MKDCEGNVNGDAFLDLEARNGNSSSVDIDSSNFKLNWYDTKGALFHLDAVGLDFSITDSYFYWKVMKYNQDFSTLIYLSNVVRNKHNSIKVSRNQLKFSSKKYLSFNDIIFL